MIIENNCINTHTKFISTGKIRFFSTTNQTSARIQIGLKLEVKNKTKWLGRQNNFLY